MPANPTNSQLRAAQRALAQTYAVVQPIARPVGWEVRYRCGDIVRVEVLAHAAPYDADAARAEAQALLPDRDIIVPRDGDVVPTATLTMTVAAAAPLRAVS